MKTIGVISGALIGAALLFVGVFWGGVLGCCSAAPSTPLGVVARELSTPGFYLASLFHSCGLPDLLALVLGGAVPGALAGLGVAGLIRAYSNRGAHDRT